MTAEEFISSCGKNGLTLSVNPADYAVIISGENNFAAQARRKLDNSRELTAAVRDVLKARAPKESRAKFHIFFVEDRHGERFKYSISCIDEVLQGALDSLGLRVISEY